MREYVLRYNSNSLKELSSSLGGKITEINQLISMKQDILNG